MSAPARDDRYHSLDSLRGFAMFLGILLHAGISFPTRQNFWPIRDRLTTPAADVLLIMIHDFRMQLFFLLAGFFSCMLYGRLGIVGLLRHRFRRVLIPFVLAVIFISPTVRAIFLYAEIENLKSEEFRGIPTSFTLYAAEWVDDHPEASPGQLVVEYFTSGSFLTNLSLVHLWFLYYLLIFYLAAALLAPILRPLGGTRFLARFDAAFRRVISGRLRILVPAILTFPLMLGMNWLVDTQISWQPRWHIVAYYFWFFAFGWVLFRHRDLVQTFGRGWRVSLLTANLLVFPVMLVLLISGMAAENEGQSVTMVKFGAFAASAIYTWLMIVGLWGLFLHYFSRESSQVRYLADSSYWCYLASLTVLGFFQLWVKEWSLAAELKFALICLLTIPILLVSYEWGVRYTFIGAILNGRKTRVQFSPEVCAIQSPNLA